MLTLDAQFGQMKSKLREILSKQKYLCVTTDVWTSSAQSYLGVTVHFLSENFERKSYILAFKQLKVKQTYDVLAEALCDVFNDYGIKMAQIRHIVTDGGSNFCKMFKEYGKAIESTTTNHFETDSDEVGDNELEMDIEDLNEYVNDEPCFMEDTNGELFQSEVLNLNSEEENDNFLVDDMTNDDLLNYLGQGAAAAEAHRIELPEQRRCISHLLNLVSKDFDKAMPSVVRTLLVKAISKLHVLWVLTHKSSRAKHFCKTILGICLLIPNETRWNALFDALKLCLRADIQLKLNTLIQKLKSELKSAENKLQLLTPSDFLVITEYVKVMEPVARSLDRMQAESNGSQGYIMPVLISMKHHISRVEESSTIAKDFKKHLLDVIEKRFSNYMSFSEANRDLILAAITIPKIKGNFIADKDNLMYSKRLLVAECKKLHFELNSNNVDGHIEDPSDTEESSKQKKKDDFIVSFVEQRNNRRNSVENDIESEVSRYLMDDRTEYAILNEYKNVKEVFYKYNTTISSSGPVERLFSQSSLIFTPRRNRLSAKKFEQAILLKHNRKILDQ